MRGAREGPPAATCVVIAAGLSLLLGACSGSSGGTSPKPETTPVGTRDNRPNIVLIQADDQTEAQFNRRVMPKTFKLLVDHGTRFTDYTATTAECCPSRASLLTGQYEHNHGVTSNDVGYPALRGKHDVLPVWLRRSGYRTMEVGAKYLNQYRKFAGKKPAPGWDIWFDVLSHTQYYDYKLSGNGHEHTRASKPADYITRVLGRKATRLIQKNASSTQPFYLQLDERAPHVTKSNDPYGDCDRLPIPDRRDEQAFADEPLQKSPSFNEKDMSDKPEYLRALKPLGGGFKGHLLKKWRCSLDTLIGVDRNVAKVVQAVKKAGELDRTVFIYISDNGLFYGQHRIVKGKVFPYEEAIRLPLVMRVPKRYRDDAPRRKRTGGVAGNIDLAPTILQLAHAKPCAHGRCRTMDGRSLMPLLTGHGHWPRDRALLNEYQLPDLPHYSTCKFAAVRTRTEIYIEHYRVVDRTGKKCQATLQKERYDLKSDPYELDSLCPGGAPDSCPHDASQRKLQRRLERLKHCAGIRGRDDRVDGRPFCE